MTAAVMKVRMGSLGQVMIKGTKLIFRYVLKLLWFTGEIQDCTPKNLHLQYRTLGSR